MRRVQFDAVKPGGLEVVGRVREAGDYVVDLRLRSGSRPGIFRDGLLTTRSNPPGSRLAE